jgi:hypothetical protein
MSDRKRGWARYLIIPVLALAATAARAEQTYAVRGPTGAAVWAPLFNGGTEAIIFAFTQSAPTVGDKPEPGPRVVFSVTQWALLNGNPVRRQWFGDAALKPEWLPIQPDLSIGQLDAEVLGTLEEQRFDGSVLKREVLGRIQIRWDGAGILANNTTQVSYQTPPYTAVLQTIGMGRPANAMATVTVEALGPPITLVGLGSLTEVTAGQVSVKTP